MHVQVTHEMHFDEAPKDDQKNWSPLAVNGSFLHFIATTQPHRIVTTQNLTDLHIFHINVTRHRRKHNGTHGHQNVHGLQQNLTHSHNAHGHKVNLTHPHSVHGHKVNLTHPHSVYGHKVNLTHPHSVQGHKVNLTTPHHAPLHHSPLSQSLTHSVNAHTVDLTDQDTSLWKFGVIRGGTPAALVGEKMARYLTFFHSSNDPPLTGDVLKTYAMGAYTFCAQPPHRILAMSEVPFVHESFYTGESDGSINVVVMCDVCCG